MFNTGDYVVCINPGKYNCLTQGKPYQVIDCDHGLVRFINDNGVTDCAAEERFKSINIIKRMSENHVIIRAFTNGPATIVLWGDGTKTVAKCGKDDVFDAEKGLAIAISKRFLGNDFKPTFEQFLIENEEKAKNVKDNTPIKAGDLVRILDGSNIHSYMGGWTREMEKQIGKIHRVSWFDKMGGAILEGLPWTWDVRGLEKVQGKENKK